MARNLGTFAIREFLISSWPTANVGDYAIVEKTETVYRYTLEGWIDSGSPADSIGKSYTASNEGSGEGEVYKEQVDTEFKFRTLKAGSNVTVTEDDNEITIASAGSEWEGWSGKVATFSLLPPAVEHDNEVWLVLQSSGVPILNYHSDGLYVSTASVWDFLGPVPDAYMDTVFRIYNNTDGSKQIAFDASNIGTGQTRTITMPDKNINLSDVLISDSSSSTVGNVLVSNNIDGKHSSDSGIASSKIVQGDTDSATVGHIATISNVNGKHVSDGGVAISKLVQGDTDTATVGHVATISNVDGKHISDSGIVATDLLISDVSSSVDGDFAVYNSTTGKHTKVLSADRVSRPLYTVVDVTSADATISSYRYKGVIITGSPAAPRSVILPTVAWEGIDVINNCTGSNAITIKTSAGTGVISYGGDVLEVYCDGTNIVLKSANSNQIAGVERLTGERWRGYPVYEKAFAGVAMVDNSNNPTAHGVSGTFSVKKIYGIAKSGTNEVALPNPQAAGLQYQVALARNGNNFEIRTGVGGWSGTTAYITMEYIKA